MEAGLSGDPGELALLIVELVCITEAETVTVHYHRMKDKHVKETTVKFKDVTWVIQPIVLIVSFYGVDLFLSS